MVKLVEIICSGNNDRSPVGELFTQQQIALRGINGYEAVSSGISVNDFQTGNVSDEGALYYINMGLELGLLSGHEKKMAEALSESSGSDKIKAYFLIANERLRGLAKQQQATALEELGFNPARLKLHREQTEPRDDAYAIFCMGQKHVKVVRGIYSYIENPIITTLDDTDIMDPYCQGIEVYKEVISQIWRCVDRKVKDL